MAGWLLCHTTMPACACVPVPVKRSLSLSAFHTSPAASLYHHQTATSACSQEEPATAPHTSSYTCLLLSLELLSLPSCIYACCCLATAACACCFLLHLLSPYFLSSAMSPTSSATRHLNCCSLFLFEMELHTQTAAWHVPCIHALAQNNWSMLHGWEY